MHLKVTFLGKSEPIPHESFSRGYTEHPPRRVCVMMRARIMDTHLPLEMPSQYL